MTRPSFWDLIAHQFKSKKFVSVGLDPEFSRLPEHLKQDDEIASIKQFIHEIIDATGDIVCAFKPNSAFYEAYGGRGIELLADIVKYIHKKFPEVIVIDDAKRADTGNTNNGYVKAIFNEIGADAVTVHPYLGREALEPFLKRQDKGIFVLCKTSNPGAGELQDLEVNEKKFYEVVAEKVASEWNTNGNCGVVVGATHPEELSRVRAIVGDIPILIPGIGAQGGDLEGSVKASKTKNNDGFIISSSRGILYASNGEDFAEAARREAEKLNSQILASF